MEKLIRQLRINDVSFALENILCRVEPAHPNTAVEELLARFSAHQDLLAIPIVSNGLPLGLVHRHEVVDVLASFGKRAMSHNNCDGLMDNQPLLVEKSTPLQEVSKLLSASDIYHFARSFIVVEQGCYIGIATAQGLLRTVTQLQIEATRLTNPITMLPGSHQISQRIEQLLQSDKPFAICCGDLDALKPLNNKFGYHKGDELIRFTGKLLAKVCEPTRDLIGHIGGGGFIFIMQSSNWEQRCHRALAEFAQTSITLFDKAHCSIGGYMAEDRQGRIIHHPLPTLSLGAARVTPEFFESHYEVVEAATAAKNMAKKKPGNSLFIERRHPHPYRLTQKQHRKTEAHYG